MEAKKKKLFSANVKTEQSKGGGASYWTFEKGGTSGELSLTSMSPRSATIPLDNWLVK